MSFSAARERFKKASAHLKDPVEKMAANYVGFGGGGYGGGIPAMPAASVGGGMGGAKIVGGWGGGGRGGKLVGSRAGSAMVNRHQADLMVQGMMQQDDFAKSYANALGRMSRGHARIKQGAALPVPTAGLHGGPGPGGGAGWTLGSLALGGLTGSALGYMSGGKDQELAKRNALLGGVAGVGAGGLGALAFNRSHRAGQAMKQDVVDEFRLTRKGIAADIDAGVDKAVAGADQSVIKAREGIMQDVAKAKADAAKGTHVNVGPLSIPVSVGPKKVKPPKSSWRERFSKAVSGLGGGRAQAPATPAQASFARI